MCVHAGVFCARCFLSFFESSRRLDAASPMHAQMRKSARSFPLATAPFGSSLSSQPIHYFSPHPLLSCMSLFSSCHLRHVTDPLDLCRFALSLSLLCSAMRMCNPPADAVRGTTPRRERRVRATSCRRVLDLLPCSTPLSSTSPSVSRRAFESRSQARVGEGEVTNATVAHQPPPLDEQTN